MMNLLCPIFYIFFFNCNISKCTKSHKLQKLAYTGIVKIFKYVRQHAFYKMKMTENVNSVKNMMMKNVMVKNENTAFYGNDEENGLQIFQIIKNYEQKWLDLQVSKNDLQLKYCFLIGQEFCYKEVVCNTYIGLVNNSIFLFKETEDSIFYQCLYDANSKSDKNGNSSSVKHNAEDYEIRENLYLDELNEFFNLQFPINEHIEIWKKKDKRMREIADKLRGLRLLKLNLRESFFSFICSSNNNIPRITLMNECLRKRYGTHIATIVFQDKDILVKTKEDSSPKNKDLLVGVHVKQEKEECTDVKVEVNAITPPCKKENGAIQTQKEKRKEVLNRKRKISPKGAIRKQMKVDIMNGMKNKNLQMSDQKQFYQQVKKEIKTELKTKIYSFYEFPTIDTLSKLEEHNLRDLGFGYRSTFIVESAKMLKKLGADRWLQDLKNERKTIDCINKLIQFPGIGLKVANCICLFGLHKYDCIPIDTHIYDIIHKYYKNLIEDIEKSANSKQRERKKKEGDDTKEKKKKGTQVRCMNNSSANAKANGVNQKVEKGILRLDKEKRKGLTRSVYARLFQGLKNIFGPNCGWAQTMLFTAELKKFADTFRKI